LRGLSFGSGGRRVFFWRLKKLGGTVVGIGVRYGGGVAQSRNCKVFFEFVPIKAWVKLER
jgi:hypothetical protein